MAGKLVLFGRKGLYFFADGVDSTNPANGTKIISATDGSIIAPSETLTGDVIIGDSAADALTVNSTSTFAAPVTNSDDITLANGKAVKTDTTTGHTLKLKAYDVDGAAYATMVTLTNGNTPSLSFDEGATVGANKTLAVTTADLLTVGGVIVPQEIEVSFHAQAAADMVDRTFFVANQAYQVTKVRFVGAVAEATAATLYAQLVKDTGTDAPGAGTDLLTNNTNNGFDCKATANTVQTGTLTATTASLQLAAGDRLSIDFSAAATELVGVTITVTLKRI